MNKGRDDFILFLWSTSYLFISDIDLFCPFKVMNKIEVLIKRVKGKSFKAGPQDKAGQQYRQWVEELYKDSIADGERFLVTYAEHLREYHVALTINTSTTMKNAKKRLERYFDSLDEEKFLPIDEQLKSLFQRAMEILDKLVEENGEPENPLLKHLKKLILKNHQDLDPQQVKDRDGKISEKTDNGANESGQEENGQEEEALENEKGATSDNGEKSSRIKDGDDKSGDGSVDGTKKGQAGGITCNGDASVMVNAADEGEKGETEEKHKKEADQDEEKATSSIDRIPEHESSDKRNGGPKEWKGPKGIIFTRTRESTEALLDWVKETKELDDVLRPEKLVGSGDGNSK